VTAYKASAKAEMTRKIQIELMAMATALSSKEYGSFHTQH